MEDNPLYVAAKAPISTKARQTYTVPYEITGEVEIVASSPDEAERIFWAMSVHDYAGDGDLWSGEPEPVELEDDE